ncbi:MAG: YggS family pyridoxal phosphate-dependent enzyme [Chitinivibrionales bacterium]
MQSVQERIQRIKREIASVCRESGRPEDDVKLIVVTKTKPVGVIQEVIESGHSIIGENRAQEIEQKIPLIGKGVEVHMIGSIQSNKVSKVVPLVDWIHSADRKKIITRIDKYSKQYEKRMNLLVQVNTSGEESKSGCAPDMAEGLCRYASELSGIALRGVMTIGPLTQDMDRVSHSFKVLKGIADRISAYCEGGKAEVSMGMSGDYSTAIKEGATMIRVGSAIVGERFYT